MSTNEITTSLKENNPSPRNRGRRARAQQHRAAKGDNAIQGHELKRDVNLFRNQSSLEQLFAKVAVSSVKSPKLIPVSIRGIGFAIHVVWTMLQVLTPLPNFITIHHLYRSALAQMTYRFSKLNQPMIQSRRSGFRNITLNSEYASAVATHPIHLSAVTTIVNLIGNFSSKDQDYYPMIPTLGNQYAMYNHDITTLRDLVLLASNQQTPVNVRLAMYNSNAIPGAIWNIDGAPFLVNPDVIMPQAYNVALYREDARVTNLLIQLICQKHPRLIGRFDDVPTGSVAMLVSVNATPMRLTVDRICAPANDGEEGEECNPPPQQRQARHINIDNGPLLANDGEYDFRSIETIPSEKLLIGACSLVGECHLEQDLPVAANQCIRTDAISSQDIRLNPISIMRAMFE